MKTIIINDERKIFAVQEEFHKMFPFLKLEFFAKTSGHKAPESKKEMIHPSKTLMECRSIRNSGNLSVSPNMTIGELEQTFRDVYGLKVQVLRKSGTTWLETTTTEDWTLEKENKTGEEMEKPETQEIQ